MFINNLNNSSHSFQIENSLSNTMAESYSNVIPNPSTVNSTFTGSDLCSSTSGQFINNVVQPTMYGTEQKFTDTTLLQQQSNQHQYLPFPYQQSLTSAVSQLGNSQSTSAINSVYNNPSSSTSFELPPDLSVVNTTNLTTNTDPFPLYHTLSIVSEKNTKYGNRGDPQISKCSITGEEFKKDICGYFDDLKDLVEIKKRINSSVNIEQDRLISSNEQYLNNVNNSLTQFSRRLRKPKAIELVDLTEDEIETAYESVNNESNSSAISSDSNSLRIASNELNPDQSTVSIVQSADSVVQSADSVVQSADSAIQNESQIYTNPQTKACRIRIKAGLTLPNFHSRLNLIRKVDSPTTKQNNTVQATGSNYKPINSSFECWMPNSRISTQTICSTKNHLEEGTSSQQIFDEEVLSAASRKSELLTPNNPLHSSPYRLPPPPYKTNLKRNYISSFPDSYQPCNLPNLKRKYNLLSSNNEPPSFTPSHLYNFNLIKKSSLPSDSRTLSYTPTSSRKSSVLSCDDELVTRANVSMYIPTASPQSYTPNHYSHAYHNFINSHINRDTTATSNLLQNVRFSTDSNLRSNNVNLPAHSNNLSTNRQLLDDSNLLNNNNFSISPTASSSSTFGRLMFPLEPNFSAVNSDNSNSRSFELSDNFATASLPSSNHGVYVRHKPLTLTNSGNNSNVASLFNHNFEATSVCINNLVTETYSNSQLPVTNVSQSLLPSNINQTSVSSSTNIQSNHNLSMYNKGIENQSEENIAPSSKTTNNISSCSLKKNDDDDDGDCVVCLERSASMVLYRCGHACLCEQCVVKVQQEGSRCPICRNIFMDAIKLYKI